MGRPDAAGPIEKPVALESPANRPAFHQAVIGISLDGDNLPAGLKDVHEEDKFYHRISLSGRRNGNQGREPATLINWRPALFHFPAISGQKGQPGHLFHSPYHFLETPYLSNGPTMIKS